MTLYRPEYVVRLNAFLEKYARECAARRDFDKARRVLNQRVGLDYPVLY